MQTKLNLYLKFLVQNVKTMNPQKAQGKLVILPTPIGNLQDITPNMLKMLFQADVIACEDKRIAGQLYTLIRNKKILAEMQDKFGSIGLDSIIPVV